jgi:hypothetical protein
VDVRNAPSDESKMKVKISCRLGELNVVQTVVAGIIRETEKSELNIEIKVK